MSKRISVICDKDEWGMLVKKAGKELDIDINYEVQSDNIITNELSDEVIKSSDAILFVTQRNRTDN